MKSFTNKLLNFAGGEDFVGTYRAFLDYWKPCFTAVHYANAVIYSGPEALKIAKPADVALINNYVGQAKCLRAFWYFELVRDFGDLPLVLDGSTKLLPRTDKLVVYDQIEKDCLEAAAVLPRADQLLAADKGRMNSGAALAILAKVYLFRASLEPTKAAFYYQKAFETAKTVIESGQFSLLPTYDAVWKTTGDFSSEGIVEGGNPVAGVTNFETSWFSVSQSPRYPFTATMTKGPASAFGWGMNLPTQDFVDAFEPGDPRKNWTVYVQGDQSNAFKLNSKEYQLICFDHSTTGYYFRKYDPDGCPNGSPYLNIKYYRYSDLILVGAEAANEINQQSSALAWLELVRGRARNTPAAPKHAADKLPGVPVQITGAGQSELREIIRKERRVELGLEGHRFYDLVRCDGSNGFNWKQVVENAQAKPGPNFQISKTAKSGLPRVGRLVSVEEKHKLSPIPDSEIRASSNTLTQNVGY